jgi:hypothetical protein
MIDHTCELYLFGTYWITHVDCICTWLPSCVTHLSHKSHKLHWLCTSTLFVLCTLTIARLCNCTLVDWCTCILLDTPARCVRLFNLYA